MSILKLRILRLTAGRCSHRPRYYVSHMQLNEPNIRQQALALGAESCASQGWMLVPMLEEREGETNRTMLETHSWPGPHTACHQSGGRQTNPKIWLLRPSEMQVSGDLDPSVAPCGSCTRQKNVCSIKEGPQDNCLYQVVTTLLHEAFGISVASLAFSHWGSQGSEAMHMNMEYL